MDASDLVGEGSFRVDRSHALEKLSRFQLPDARMYLLPWVRAAVASRAKGIRVAVDRHSIELSFDGKAWPVERLEDPYRHLFAEEEVPPGGGGARYRELAVGLLAALRLKPERITVTTSALGSQAVLELRSLQEEDLRLLGPRSAAPDRLAIRVHMPGPFDRELEFLKRAARHCPVAFEFAGLLFNVQPFEPGPYPSVSFSEQGCAGVLAVSPRALQESRVDFVVLGATAATERLELALPCEGFLRDDGLARNLSQSGLARDGRWRRAAGLLARESERLLASAVLAVRAAGPSVAEALSDAGLRRYWMAREGATLAEAVADTLTETAEAVAMEAFTNSSEGQRAKEVERLCVIVAALRRGCLGLRAGARPEAAPLAAEGDLLVRVEDALRAAPALFDAQGGLLSVGELEDQFLWLGHIPCSERRLKAAKDRRLAVAWTPRQADRAFLEAYFGAGVVRAFDAARLDSMETVEARLKQENLLAKAGFSEGAVHGEVGLSLGPHPKLARIFWLRKGYPLGMTPWYFGGLRLEAVADHPGLRGLPREGDPDPAVLEALAVLRSAAAGVYEFLGAGYDHRAHTHRAAISREHLLDLLLALWDGGRQACKEPWLEGLKLFRSSAGEMLSVADIRAAAAVRKVVLAGSPHPESLRYLSYGAPSHTTFFALKSQLVSAIEPLPGQGRAEPPPPPVDLELQAPAPEQPPILPLVAEHARQEPVLLPPPPEPAAPPPAPPPAAQPRSPEEPAPAPDLAGQVGELCRSFGAIAAMTPVLLEPAPGGAILSRRPEGWLLNAAHPVVRRIRSAAPPRAQAVLLASVLLTALHRLDRSMTHAREIELQLALVEAALE